MGKRIWSFINSNIVILIIGSIIVGRGIIIPVLGTEPSIPVTLVVILVIFLVMTASFYRGGVHMVGGMFGWFWKKQKMPLRARILFKAASIMASANPICGFQGGCSGASVNNKDEVKHYYRWFKQDRIKLFCRYVRGFKKNGMNDSMNLQLILQNDLVVTKTAIFRRYSSNVNIWTFRSLDADPGTP